MFSKQYQHNDKSKIKIMRIEVTLIIIIIIIIVVVVMVLVAAPVVIHSTMPMQHITLAKSNIAHAIKHTMCLSIA